MKQDKIIEQAKQAAKRLVERSSSMGIQMTQSQALELVATDRGFATWHAFAAELRKKKPTAKKVPAWRKSHGPMTIAQYLSHAEPNRCPYCGADEVEGDEVTIEGREAFQDCSCGACEAQWQDCYQLTGYVGYAPYEASMPQTGTADLNSAPVYAYKIVVFDQVGFVATGTAFGRDEAEAWREYAAVKRFSTQVSYRAEKLGQVRTDLDTLLTWWAQHDAPEDVLDELVHEFVQEKGLPMLNEAATEAAQEQALESADVIASRINNEGIEAQFKYLASVMDPSALLTRLSTDIGFQGLPAHA